MTRFCFKSGIFKESGSPLCVVVFFSQMGFLNRLFFFLFSVFGGSVQKRVIISNVLISCGFLLLVFFFDPGEKILLSHQFLLFLFIFMFFLKVYALLMYLFYDFDVK